MEKYLGVSGLVAVLALSSWGHLPSATDDLTADFAAEENPNGVWSYGWSVSRGSEFFLTTDRAEDLACGQLTGWVPSCSPGIISPAYAVIDWTCGSEFISAGTVNLHPGPAGENTVIRWTAPASGTCEIEGQFWGNSSAPTTSDVAVLHGTDEIFSGTIESFQVPLDFSIIESVNADETIDFAVGWGLDGNFSCDATGIHVTISLDSDVVPSDMGVIYYSYGNHYHSMNPDGTGKTLLMLNLREWSEPSKYLHGGARWFLTALPLGGEGETYPDGRPRYEIHAVSTEGARVRLTSDPSLQPLDPEQAVGPPDFHGLRRASLRWALDDRKASWVARRWGKDSRTGKDAVVEVGIYAVELAADVSEGPLAATPVRMPVDVATIEINLYGLAPDVLGHDWSPDGQSVVFGTSTGLCVSDLSKGEKRTLAASGAYPRCSPDGRIVAFDHDTVCGGIDAVALSDPGAAPGTILASNEKLLSCGAVWSPSGSHLAYTCNRPSNKPPPTGTGDDIRRARASGQESVLLTRDLPESAHPMGWRSDRRSTFFRRSDSDSNGSVNLTDAVFTLNHLFLGAPAPACLDAADSDDDGKLSITDGIYVLNHLFLGGPVPPAPFPECGAEEEEDGLDCAVYPRCP